MKRKDIKQAISEAKANGAKIREKADFYRNIFEKVWRISDKERCDYYDQISLYVLYGIEPNLDTFSDQKRGDFELLFQLLKKQRIGWEVATKSADNDKTPYEGNPQGTPYTYPSFNKDIKNKGIKDKDKKEESKEEEVARVMKEMEEERRRRNE